MRYEDSSHTGSGQVDARNDADHLAARDYGPATGNVISGIGTITGSAGLDMVDSGAGKITAIDGAGGSDSSFSAGKLSVHGQYGTLSIDARGNYSYERDPGSSAGVSDVFHYTLANKAGATDIARLVINIGDLPKLATEGTRVVPGADGVVTLPAGVALSDIHIVGRDLVVTLPDGSTMIIVDGAVFVPQLVLDGVEVPATNLAALLIGSEPRPAAGDFGSDQQSSGGNFAVPVSPLDPGVPLGDLLPPTELGYTPPEFHEPGQFITQNDAPLIVSSAIAVSEEGLPNGLPDTNPGPPQDTTNLSVVSGTVAVSDANGDPLTVGLGAPPAGLTSGGVALTWVVSPDGHLLTGSAGGNTVVTISITDAGAYTVTLLRPIDHPTGAGENTTSIVVPVTVSDGSLAAAGSITVTFEDDSPNASAAAAASGITVDETSAAIPGFPLTATSAGAIVTLSGAFGADGPAASGSTVYGLSLTGGVGSLASGLFTSNGHQAITLVQTNSTTITGTFGASQTAFVLVINPNGTVTYTQSVALDHVTDGSSADALNDTSTPITLAGLVNATIALTDFDGDSATGSVAIGDRIRVFDDGPSASLVSGERVEPTLTVDETALGTNASASFAGLFSTAYGADGAGTTVYSLNVVAGPSGLTDTATGQAVILSLNGGVVEGRTAISGDLVFTVSVNGSGVVTLDQQRAVVHTTSSNPDTSEGAGLSADNLVSLTVTVKDGDGDSATASVNIGSNLSFLDDGPSLGMIQNGTANNSIAAALTTGSLHFTPGADGAGSAMTIGATLAGVHSGGFNLVTNQVGNVLTAYQDANGNGVYNSLIDTTAVFTLTITPTGGPGGGFYTFDLITPLSPTVVNTPLGGTTSFGSGPAPYQVLSGTNVATDPLTIITGWHTDGTFNAANWYNGTNVLPAGVTIASVNGSTSGWGVDNNNFTAGEFIRWDFGEPIDDFDGPGGYIPPNPAVNLPNISTVTFELIGYTASDHFQWVVHFTDGTFANFTNDGTAGIFTYSAPSGKIIDWVDTYTADAGSGKIDIVSVGVESTSLNNNLGFSVQLTDGDGDPTGTGNFTINVQTSNVPSSATPVVLDTNGDGVVSFIAHDAGAHYDYNGDGKAEATAWVAPGDSILVRDANGNGLVDNASEFVFGHDGMTDLEALHAQYGAQLDASDADFTMFAVWNDGNSNGIVDSGELMSLAEAGITSIGLVSNGVSYATAGGDVNVAGSSSFTRADGTTGTVADASFLRTADSSAQTERVAANSNSVVVAAAIAAAGLAVSSSAAAAVGETKADVGHAVQAIIPVTTFDLSNIGLHTETAVSALTGGMGNTFNVPQGMPHVAIGADIGSLGSGEIAGAHGAVAAPAELLAGSDMIAGQMAMPIFANNIAMPSLDALVAMAGPGSAQSASSVQQIVAEALHGGGSGLDINALLNALPGPAGGADAAPQIMASLGNGSVPSWDTGHGGAFTFAATDAITSEALVLHHDAIQPIANG